MSGTQEQSVRGVISKAINDCDAALNDTSYLNRAPLRVTVIRSATVLLDESHNETYLEDDVVPRYTLYQSNIGRVGEDNESPAQIARRLLIGVIDDQWDAKDPVYFLFQHGKRPRGTRTSVSRLMEYLESLSEDLVEAYPDAT